MVLRLSAKVFAIFAIKQEETSESLNLKTSCLPNKISRIKELPVPLSKTGAPLTSNSGSASDKIELLVYQREMVLYRKDFFLKDNKNSDTEMLNARLYLPF